MKKLGFLFILALVSHGVKADKVGTQYSNMAIAISEAGTSISWAADHYQSEASEEKLNELTQDTEQTRLKVNIQLQQRITELFKNSFEQ